MICEVGNVYRVRKSFEEPIIYISGEFYSGMTRYYTGLLVKSDYKIEEWTQKASHIEQLPGELLGPVEDFPEYFI